jgi:hypothetical protein
VPLHSEMLYQSNARGPTGLIVHGMIVSPDEGYRTLGGWRSLQHDRLRSIPTLVNTKELS